MTFSPALRIARKSSPVFTASFRLRPPAPPTTPYLLSTRLAPRAVCAVSRDRLSVFRATRALACSGAQAAGEPACESALIATLAAALNDVRVCRVSCRAVRRRWCRLLRLTPAQDPSVLACGSRPGGEDLVRRFHEPFLGPEDIADETNRARATRGWRSRDTCSRRTNVLLIWHRREPPLRPGRIFRPTQRSIERGGGPEHLLPDLVADNGTISLTPSRVIAASDHPGARLAELLYSG
jgi:hypothetical protein